MLKEKPEINEKNRNSANTRSSSQSSMLIDFGVFIFCLQF